MLGVFVCLGFIWFWVWFGRCYCYFYLVVEVVCKLGNRRVESRREGGGSMIERERKIGKKGREEDERLGRVMIMEGGSGGGK